LDNLREIYEKDITKAQVKNARKRFKNTGKREKKKEMNIDNFDEMHANNEIHLKNFDPYDCESFH